LILDHVTTSESTSSQTGKAFYLALDPQRKVWHLRKDLPWYIPLCSLTCQGIHCLLLEKLTLLIQGYRKRWTGF